MSSRIGPTLLFLLLPAWAAAHGEEVLYPFFTLIGSIGLFLVIILAVRLPYAVKALLVTVYLITTAGICILLSTLPFSNNASILTLLVGAVPMSSVLVAYLLVRLRHNKL
ncbi:hypothetical protein A8B98_24400 [Hymenobacter sp. UV11]|nr:hypothetical protein A8B98_24400 [Hymenobacter sp. UV11]